MFLWYIQIKGVNILAELLQIKDLKVSVEDKQILKGIDLTINKGEIHVVWGLMVLVNPHLPMQSWVTLHIQ